MAFALLSLLVLFLLQQQATAPTTPAAVNVPSVPLVNGVSRPGLTMPAVGIGTGGYRRDPSQGPGEVWTDDVAEKAVGEWLKLGGRRIDESYTYHNQKGVGLAISASSIPREELFVVSKVGPVEPLGYNDTLAQMQPILDTLQVEYVDLLLIHWPGPTGNSNNSTDPHCQGNPPTWTACRQSTWRAMIELMKRGKTRAIGVSNFEKNHLEDIVAMNKASSDVPLPAVNQVEFHLYWHEDELVKYCKSLNIVFNGYSPLARPDIAPAKGHWNHTLLQDPVVQSVAKAHGRSAAQVILRWEWQQGVIINPRSLNPDHMRENLNIFDFELSEDEMKQLASIKPPDHPKICPDPHLIN